MVEKESAGAKLAVGDMMLVTREHDNVSIMEIWGDVDIHSAGSLNGELGKLLCTERHILLNLSQTYYIDSIGISLIIALQKRQMEKGKFLGLCSPPDNIQRILNLAKLNGFFTIFENESDALCAFSEGHALVTI